MLLLLTSSFVLVSHAWSQPTLVRVRGAATVHAESETAEFYFGVVAYADEADQAADSCAKKTAATIDALRKRLGPDADIATLSYSIYPNRKYSKRGPEEVAGYSVENSLRARIDDVSNLGAILDVASSAGADRITAVHFSVKDPSALEEKAFKEAVAQARSRAEAIAKAVGQRVLRITAIDDAGAVQARPLVGSVTETIDAGATPIVGGSAERRAAVVLTAEIGP